jgi:hypothetical protein
MAVAARSGMHQFQIVSDAEKISSGIQKLNISHLDSYLLMLH